MIPYLLYNRNYFLTGFKFLIHNLIDFEISFNRNFEYRDVATGEGRGDHGLPL